MAGRRELKFKKEEDRFLSDIDGFRDNPSLVEEFIIGAGCDYFKMMPDGEYKFNMLRKIYRNSFIGDPDKGRHSVVITDKEVEFLQSLPDDLIKRLFYSLLVRIKVKPHSSGWTSLDFDNTILYGFDEREARKMKIEILSQCVPFGFEVQVSGSTKPVLCFKIPVIEEGDVVFEFEDGQARQMFAEVIGFDFYSNR